MTSIRCSSALVESVASALSLAVSDPVGHSPWILCYSEHQCLCKKRRRGAKETQRAATVFDSSAVPPITIHDYLKRLSAHFQCSDGNFIVAFIMADRLLQHDQGHLPLTMQNVHRLFLASLMVAVKFHEDYVYKNSHYAKAGGVRLSEVNRLERVLLLALDFDLRIDPDDFHRCEAALKALRPATPDVGLSGGVLAAPMSGAVQAQGPRALAVIRPGQGQRASTRRWRRGPPKSG